MTRYANDRQSLERDCEMEFFIASGPGGQRRNKVETGVRLVHRATGLVVTATERRSQSANREAAFKRMAERIARAQRVRKVRKPTRPTLSSKRQRVESKKRKSDLKQSRSQLPEEE